MISAEMKMASRNLVGNLRRTLLTLTMMSVGLAALFFLGGWIEFIKIGFREQLIKEDLGHFQIYPKGHGELKDNSQSELLFSSEEEQVLTDILYDIPGVDAVNPRIYYAGNISGKDYSSRIFLGYSGDPDLELEMGSPTMVEGDFLNPKYTNPIVLGQGLAAALNVGVGDSVTLLVAHERGRIDANTATVSGLADFQITDLNNRMAISTLEMAYQLVEGSAQRLVVTLEETELLSLVLNQLEAKIGNKVSYEILTWEQLADYYHQVLQLYNNQLVVLSVIMLLMFAVMITNTIYMSVMERQTEIGTLRAIGISRREIVRIILNEGVLLGVGGLLGGVALGLLLAGFLAQAGLEMAPPPGLNESVRIGMILTGKTVFLFGGLQVLISFFASLIPATKAVRLNIISAIRHIG